MIFPSALRPVRGAWSEGATEFCRSFTAGKLVTVEVLENGDTHCVTVQDDTGNDLAQLLLTQGFAKPLEEGICSEFVYILAT